MKNALERMDDLITCTLSSNPNSTNNLPHEQANCRIEDFIAEKDNIRKELLHPSLSFRTDEEWELYIRRYYRVITYLADLVSNYREENTVAVSDKLYTDLLRILFDLLAFIQQRFSFYLSRDEKMPVALQQVKRKLLLNMLQRFTSVFNSKINDLTLYAAVIKPVTSFLQAEIHKVFSYSKTDYLFHYLSALKNLPSNTETPVLELISILVRMNCNSVTLKKYLIEKMKADVQNCGTGKLVRKKLESWQDFYREIPVRSNMCWNKDSVSLKEELQLWIESRLLQQANGQGSQHNTRIQPTEKANEAGLFFMMTVEELALRKRVEKESGFLSNNNITEMMQQLAVILHSTKQYDVSWQNLYNSTSVLL